MARETIAELYDLFRDLDRRIASFDKKIDGCSAVTTLASASLRSRVSVRRPPRRSSPQSAMARSSRTVAILPPGLALFPGSSRAATEKS